MKVNPTPFHTAQAAITGLVVIFSIAILGTSAHTLSVFNAQRTTNPWWAPLLPSQHFDTHGTKALVASSVVTLVLSGAFLVASFVPKLNLREKYTLRALLALGTTLPSLLLSLSTLVWAHILNRNSPAVDTIQTWTCHYQSERPQNTNTPRHLSNADYAGLCRESRFALYATLVVFLLLAVSMLVTMGTWVADKMAGRRARKEGEEMGVVTEYPKC